MKPIIKTRKTLLFVVALSISATIVFWTISARRPLEVASSNATNHHVSISNNATSNDASEAARATKDVAPRYVPVRPEECSDAQKREILRQFDGGSRVRLTQRTACPSPTWWKEFYLNDRDRPDPSRPKVSISIGCNKGNEAVDSLARLSRDPAIDAAKWVQAEWGERQVCGSPPPYPIRTRNEPVPTQLYCVEAMPSTVKRLRTLVEEHQLQSKMHVLNYVMDDMNGVVPFPNVATGVEHLGADYCQEHGEYCANVTQITLDELQAKHIPSSENTGYFVDILTVDTEGNDWPVLSAGRGVLKRTRYLEFEHHEIGAWQRNDLKDVVDDLYGNHGFVCYFAGHGKLWRLTECWIDFFNTKTWSNVACVNSRDPSIAPLAKRMENLFLRTIASSTTS